MIGFFSPNLPENQAYAKKKKTRGMTARSDGPALIPQGYLRVFMETKGIPSRLLGRIECPVGILE